MKNIITFNDVTKIYKLYNKPIDRIIEFLIPFKKNHKKSEALKNITFNVKKGEIIGIIGENGAGKSTLLKLITQVSYPTSGKINIEGKISSLLELGTGFNMELSGYDNIIIYGQLNGYSKKQMLNRINDIISFADIGEYIYQPVKFYSSGMFARLAFSVAINVDPDILIVDEILSVGDAKFQQKSYEKFLEFKNNGKTIVFVSHSLDVVKKFCTRVIWLEKGKINEIGDPTTVVEKFYSHIMNFKYQDSMNATEKGSNEFCFLEKVILKNKVISFGTDNEIIFKYVPINKLSHPVIKVDLYLKLSNDGTKKQFVCNMISSVSNVDIDWNLNKINEVKLVLPNVNLSPGNYTIDVSFADKTLIKEYDKFFDVAEFRVDDKYKGDGLMILNHDWVINEKNY